MYHIIQIGPISLPMKTLVLIGSAFLALCWIYLLQIRHTSVKKWTIPIEWGYAVLWVIIIWKLSYVLIHPLETIQYPLRIMYFDGGIFGLVFGIAVGVYSFHKSTSKVISLFTPRLQMGISGLLFWFGTYSMLYTLVFTVHHINILIGVYFITLALTYWYKLSLKNIHHTLRLIQWGSAGWITSQLIFEEQEPSQDIWFVFIVWLFIFFIDMKLSRKRK
ncbi:hypothetical protein GLW08_00940 [Pontibacillus yanchengensis]|uniref:Uncharacterized protein n=2 Tax=Pontibacillus yanchengensis TaxID=462910 RepID=A0ACC7VD71_9BACI|nr:hypothetical protein [Pontibacillus yanchengensis]MYL33270.1 hypothetical protein [Pontibacillus yanchengensis]MYL51894.1 hypothetical protein [Pontibacillus yanchengensis]